MCTTFSSAKRWCSANSARTLLYTSDYRRGRKDRIRDRNRFSDWVRVSDRCRFRFRARVRVKVRLKIEVKVRVRVRVRAGETNIKTAATNPQYRVE